MSTSQFSKFAVPLTSLLIFFSTIVFSPSVAAELRIGSSNTAFADPPVPRPQTAPCKVTLYSEFKFDNFTPQNFPYTPPSACPGPWAKVILEANFSVTKGIQFDRTANIWIGPTNIYFGTTSEPDPSTARNWHVERDLTDYTSIFTVPQTGTVDLFNVVNQTYTGVLHGSADLLFYPLAPGQLAPASADQVIAFSGGPTGGTIALNTTTDLLEQTVTLPTNIASVFFDVFAQSQHDDEFWYTCVPDDLASELQSCPGTAFRESEVTIDGIPAGVAPVYPWIFTGGIDPFLWIPIPGVQTMNFQPYRVNLTPFAAVLDDGQPHTIALSVFNADSYFSATASLLLYLDPNTPQFTGAVTTNTLAVPNPNIVENIHSDKNGNIQGAVVSKSGHSFEISGYINSQASGLVTTTVAQDINFSNIQHFRIQSSTYEQDIDQTTKIHSVVTIQDAGGIFTNTVNHDWPLKLDISVLFNADGSGTQTTTVNQYYEKDQVARHRGQATSFSLLQDRALSTDALDFNSSGQITGNQNQSSGQKYFTSNSTGYCYSRAIAAAASVLTKITDGIGCQ